MSTVFRDLSSVDAMPSHVETSNRIFGLSSGKPTFRSGLLSQDNRLSMQFGSGNNIDNMLDQRQRTSHIQSTSTGMRSFGLQSRNLTLHSSVLQERSMRLNQDLRSRNNISATISKPFWPAVRNTTLTTGLQMQDSVTYNEDVDEGTFRRPTISRVIRGRNSTLSSRLFHNQNAEKHYKDLSNINGFNVSHISRRDVDSFSESRLALNTRSNWLDNQSVSGSILSVTSMKAQFMNVLENLHHSILNIGPHVTAEAVRMEFDKAKQGLENISEMSFTPSIRPANAASVISQSSKYICPPIGETTTTNVLDGGSLNLKSSKDLLKTLISSKDNYKSKFNLTTHEEEGGVITSSKKKDSDEEESIVFKKPKPYNRKPRSSRIMKIRAPQVVKSSTSKGGNTMINLHQWYPVAVGSDLAFCGLDEKGSSVKTEPVKKRLNNRKVELITGSSCNLIGSPSAMVSVLPKKIVSLLKNGLTDRWRVLQKELLNCQTAEEEVKKRKSKSPKKKSPKMKSPPEKKVVEKGKKEKSKSPKVISTPVKKGKVSELQTRSGRTVKPPGMFWLAIASNEVTSTLAGSETIDTTPKSKEKSRSSIGGTPSKKSKESARKKKESEGSSKRKEKVSPKKSRKAVIEHFSKNSTKGKSPRKNKREEKIEEVEVHSSTDSAKGSSKSQNLRGKRKREVVADAESVQSKKSKVEKESEMEVESTVKTSRSTVKRGRKVKSPPVLRSPKPKKQKSSSKRKEVIEKKTVKSVTENNKETDFSEFERNFEFKLDDIEIPEIANISGNPLLSRSQLRLVSMETPPLKYFNSNLKLLKNATPVRSPDWCISQRSESEVKQFQRRREEAFKKRIKMDIRKTVVTEKSQTVQNRDVKRVMEWVAEKTVKSPQWNSKVLQYVIPSRKRMEQEEEEEDDYENFETEFL